MRSIFIIFLVFGLLQASLGNAFEYIQSSVPQAQKVGEGRLSYLFWDVYDASLYAPEGQLDMNKPFALKLFYLRDVEGEAIADRSAEEIRDQGFSDEVKLATWHEQMRKIFPNVEEGMSLTGIYNGSGTTIFFADGVELGRVKDAEFSRVFFDIWLSEKTSSPDLRRQLLGGV